MTEQSNNHSLAESLSALADNQASPLELRRVLKASEEDPEVKATWSRYQIISAAMRRDLPAFEGNGLADRVSAAIEEEESHQGTTGTGRKLNSWWQNMGRAAVAASVAVAAVVGVQQLPVNPATDQPSAGGPTAQSSDPGPSANGGATQPAVSLPAGYNAPSLPTARTASARSGYEPRAREAQQVMFVPRQESVPVSAEEIRAHLNHLIQQHSDHAALNSNQGALPYARVVADDED